jgi:hypothetical protein
MPGIFKSLLLVCVGTVLITASAWADDLSGLYDAQGRYPGGKEYQGAVKIVDFGSAQAILWKLNDGEDYKGLAIHQGDVLGAAYTTNETPFGLVVYKIDGGRLDGQWLNSGDAKAELGREILEGSGKLTGQYQITLGENRDGTTNYTGQVMIKPDGESFVLIWLVPKPAYIGRGIRVGNTLVVSFSRITNPNGGKVQVPGVVAYQVKDANTLQGVWSSGGNPRVGTETLTRRVQ